MTVTHSGMLNLETLHAIDHKVPDARGPALGIQSWLEWRSGTGLGSSNGHLSNALNPGDMQMADKQQDLEFLRRTIALADQAVREGNHPFGSVLVSRDGKILAEGKNSYAIDKGPGHAETNLARDAARKFDVDTLRAATLYTSVEPCSMCSGSIYWAEIGAVVFGMTERRLGELTGDDPENPTQDLECRVIFASGKRAVAVRGPFEELEDEIAAQHSAFWSTT